jgi:hypothetical protein
MPAFAGMTQWVGDMAPERAPGGRSSFEGRAARGHLTMTDADRVGPVNLMHHPAGAIRPSPPLSKL